MIEKTSLIMRLAACGRRIVRSGLVISTGGNISAREGPSIYIKRKGSPLDSPAKAGYVMVDLRSGRPSGGVPSSEIYMHLACYRKRRDIGAVLHLHPVFSTAVANSRVKLGPISYELAACLGSDICRARYRASGSRGLAAEISSKIGGYNAVLLPNHGILIVAGSVETAFERALACERACQTLIFSRLLGVYSFLPRKEADRITKLYGGDTSPSHR